MKFFSAFASQLQPAWTFSASHTLWRVIFSHNGFIVCEERNTDEKIVSFSCIESATGKILWRNRCFAEQWWIGIEGITNDRLYLHGFKKPDMPEHLGIIAVDLATGNELWRSMQSSFLTDDGTFVFGFKDLFERKVFHKIDRNSGMFVEQIETLPGEIEQNIQLEKTDFLFPNTGMVSDPEIGNALSILRIEKSIVKSIEFARIQSIFILSLYTDAGGTMKNTLSIIDTTTQKKVYSDVLNESTPYPVPDSFFIDNDMLYYVKERKTFVALKLPQ